MSGMRILTVVGARPQFVKAAMVSRAIVAQNKAGTAPKIVEEIVHTGQHYDRNMSHIFFNEMGIPEPAVNLKVGSGSHGAVTGEMLAGIEREILARKPDRLLVYGDTNSTLAGALAAAKLHVPVAHVEAGLRSFNRRMPEEVNRVLTDHVSELLFCPTATAVKNLQAEGITKGVHVVGDVMYDAAKVFGEIAERRSDVLARLGLGMGGHYLATVHRAENTDDPARLRGILEALVEPHQYKPVVLPIHPRTRRFVDEYGYGDLLGEIRAIDPVSFLDMVRLEQGARMILTDSGGVQKEAYFHGVPCVTLRDETEWVETVERGWNQVVGASKEAILEAAGKAATGSPIPDYGTGDSAERMVALLTS